MAKLRQVRIGAKSNRRTVKELAQSQVSWAVTHAPYCEVEMMVQDIDVNENEFFFKLRMNFDEWQKISKQIDEAVFRAKQEGE